MQAMLLTLSVLARAVLMGTALAGCAGPPGTAWVLSRM